MRAAVGLAIALVLATTLPGCAYKPLKAPCSPDEGGVPLAYAESPAAPALPPPLRSLDRCGPMKPI